MLSTRSLVYFNFCFNCRLFVQGTLLNFLIIGKQTSNTCIIIFILIEVLKYVLLIHITLNYCYCQISIIYDATVVDRS